MNIKLFDKFDMDRENRKIKVAKYLPYLRMVSDWIWIQGTFIWKFNIHARMQVQDKSMPLFVNKRLKLILFHTFRQKTRDKSRESRVYAWSFWYGYKVSGVSRIS